MQTAVNGCQRAAQQQLWACLSQTGLDTSGGVNNCFDIPFSERLTLTKSRVRKQERAGLTSEGVLKINNTEAQHVSNKMTNSESKSSFFILISEESKIADLNCTRQVEQKTVN